MEHEISRRFNEDILAEARERFGISADKIKELDGFESFIFEFEKDSRDYILRIGHSRRRSPELIHGEVDWINYLAAGGAGVARAIFSDNGELVEAIDDGEDGQFLATAFVKARGGPPSEAFWNEQLFVPYGRLIGRMHKLSKTYRPGDPAWRRPSWDDPIMQFGELLTSKAQTAVLDRYRRLMEHLQALPQDKESYGLIHQDAHGGNFFVDETYQITLFDFDDCVYGHFINDIAMVMFYAITNWPEPEQRLAELWIPFMQGYLAENELDPAWFREILPFMKLRELDLYAILFDLYGSKKTGDGWIDSFMHGRRRRIENDVPYVNFSFEL
jgi:Ser/Thr protein kinase RdoA (MazF antagonist)